MAKKKSTAEILAQLRAEAGSKGGTAGGNGDQSEPAAAPAADAPPAGVPSTVTPEAATPAEPAEPAEPATAPPPAAAPPRPDAGKPRSTKDILAAARAAAAGGGAAPAPAKPAVPVSARTAPAAAKTLGKQPTKPAAAPAGTRPTVQEMLRAAREGRSPEQPAAEKPAAAAPPKPRVPAAARKAKQAEAAERPTRRNVVLALVATPFALAWTSFTAAAAAFTLGLARFMMPNVLVERPSRFKIGPPSDYPPDMVSEKWKPGFGVWVVNTIYDGQRQIYALLSTCTHLGCTPNWLQGEQKFKCPCHGSGFYMSGVNFEGPAPRPLERAGISVAPDGMLEVDTSRKFQEEMGQWSDPNSFVPIV